MNDSARVHERAPNAAASFRVRKYRAGDEHGIVALLNRAFGADPRFREKTIEWWRWKYEQIPTGKRILCVERSDGEIVGHYGGLITNLRTRRRTFEAFQGCDACIDPDLGLSRGRVFVRMARAISTFAGPGGIGAAYGLPTPDHLDLGVRHAGYRVLRPQPVLVCRRGDALPPIPRGLSIDHVDALPADVNRFLTGLERRFPVLAERNAAFLHWRFMSAPGRPYGCGVARSRDGGAIRGLAFYRSGSFLGRKTGVIVDWLVPPDDREAGVALFHYAATKALSDGIEELTCFMPPACQWSSLFRHWGFSFEPTAYEMVFHELDPSIDHDEVRRDWYYTLADLDTF